MRHRFFFFFLAFSFSLSAQIAREFKSEKVDTDIAQSIEKQYENVLLDETGKPILSGEPTSESLNFFENGNLVETQSFDIEDGKKELSIRIVLKRQGDLVESAKVYAYSISKESLLRAHKATIENGKIVSEIISNGTRDVGTVAYTYGQTQTGRTYEKMEVENLNRTFQYYTEFEKEEAVFAMQTSGSGDTLIRQFTLENDGETFKKSLLIQKSRNGGFDSILLSERKWVDEKENTSLVLMRMEALTEPPEGEPQAMNFVTSFTYISKEKAEKPSLVFPENTEILGAWRSESDNIELFFEPEDKGKQRLFASSYLSKSNAPSVEELVKMGEVWKYMLIQELSHNVWSLEENGDLAITLKNGSELLFSTKMDFKTMILTPKMEGMKGQLRLVKSK